jgi:hypothetical protein
LRLKREKNEGISIQLAKWWVLYQIYYFIIMSITLNVRYIDKMVRRRAFFFLVVLTYSNCFTFSGTFYMLLKFILLVMYRYWSSIKARPVLFWGMIFKILIKADFCSQLKLSTCLLSVCAQVEASHKGKWEVKYEGLELLCEISLQIIYHIFLFLLFFLKIIIIFIISLSHCNGWAMY